MHVPPYLIVLWREKERNAINEWRTSIVQKKSVDWLAWEKTGQQLDNTIHL